VVEHFQTLRVRVIGGVENMTGLECPHCGELIEVFPPVSTERSLWSLGVAKLASLPLDPSLAGARQNGDVPESFRALARTVADAVNAP
jgi:Mrp family chromosome partitioning ATPase